ncbi:MAG: hypothetical protein COT74_09860 [Bdellovibrionales bacterium CG10_big_fil_rev_8_21_14_0_10_45_34]|nr:MAG: hypothetical protein COT74_09860 [Bdellovibrionales bacterium CG10_big_fil_rev_8_21_14_0_10_45_34]
MTSRSALVLFSFVILVISVRCGTQDYGEPVPHEDKASPAPPAIEQPLPPTVPATPAADTNSRGSAKEENLAVMNVESAPRRGVFAPVDYDKEGYFWKSLSWVGIPDGSIHGFKSSFIDGPDTNEFEALGMSIIGGAVLGLVIRGSGSWLFGRPIETKSGHRFWQTLEKASKATAQGAVRGGLAAGACFLFLSGTGPYNGVLGGDFTAASAALSLAGVASIATGAALSQMSQRHWDYIKAQVKSRFPEHSLVGRNGNRIAEWTRHSEIGDTVIHKIAPGIFIAAIGAGVGVIVYQWLDD